MRLRLLPLALALAAIAIISAASSFLTLRIVSRDEAYPAKDYHEWIHKRLNMTAEQERRSLASERHYEETKRHLEEVIRLANSELAESILHDKSYSPSVEKSVAEIHNAMGQLQTTERPASGRMTYAIYPKEGSCGTRSAANRSTLEKRFRRT